MSGWHDLFKLHQKSGKHQGGVSLIHWDPWYQENKQPGAADFVKMAEASCYYASSYCVMIVWTPWQAAPDFSKAFVDTGKWHLVNSMQYLIRTQNRIGRYGATGLKKNVTDAHMVLYHIDEGTSASMYTFNTTAVNDVYGNPQKDSNINGGYRWTSNIILDYDPPSVRSRLKDGDGTALRPQAEKSQWYMRLLLTAYTKPGQVVFDGMAGTFSMSLACCITGRKSVACDHDAKVFKPVSPAPFVIAIVSSVFPCPSCRLPLSDDFGPLGSQPYHDIRDGEVSFVQ
jgi:hypothetical protein